MDVDRLLILYTSSVLVVGCNIAINIISLFVKNFWIRFWFFYPHSSDFLLNWSTAYLNNGNYNVFVVDWGKLSAIPCYAAAVHNMRSVAKCIAVMLSHLRTSGLNVDQLTCVGHSLGAHVCGMMANYLPFRMYRIIGKWRHHFRILCDRLSLIFPINFHSFVKKLKKFHTFEFLRFSYGKH